MLYLQSHVLSHAFYRENVSKNNNHHTSHKVLTVKDRDEEAALAACKQL